MPTTNASNFWRTVTIVATVAAVVALLYAIIPAPTITIREGPNIPARAGRTGLDFPPEWRLSFKTVYPSDTAQIKFPELLPVISMMENEGLSEIKNEQCVDCVVVAAEMDAFPYNAQSFVVGLEPTNKDHKLSCYLYHVGSMKLFTQLRDYDRPKPNGDGFLVKRTMRFDVPSVCATYGSRLFSVVKLCSLKEKIPSTIFEDANKHIALKVN